MNGRRNIFTATLYQISSRSVKPLQRYRDFCDFQNGGCRHLDFSKIRNFNGLSAVTGPIRVIMPNFIKIGQTVADVWRFNVF